MAFEKLVSLRADRCIKIGGENTSTGKPNPAEIEGFYLGFLEKEGDRGKYNLYLIKTPSETVGVYSTAYLINEMLMAKAGLLTKITFKGLRKVSNGTMYVYDVQQDPSQTIKVPEPVRATKDENNYVAQMSEESYNDDNEDYDPPPPPAYNKSSNASAILNKRKQGNP